MLEEIELIDPLRTLHIDDSDLQKRRERELEKITQMQALVAADCRRKYLSCRRARLQNGTKMAAQIVGRDVGQNSRKPTPSEQEVIIKLLIADGQN